MEDGGDVSALVRRAQQGNQNAFNELYRLTRDRAYFVAFSSRKTSRMPWTSYRTPT